MIKFTRFSARLLVACKFKGQKSTGGGGSGNEANRQVGYSEIQAIERTYCYIILYTCGQRLLLLLMLLYTHMLKAGLKVLSHDISEQFFTKFKLIVRGPSFR